jgi:histidine triad (HIT) family protein
MPSIFSKIIAGEIPSYKVAENDACYAFLDINPLHEGHLLVVPKQEVDYLFDLPEALYHKLWAFARELSAALEKAIPCKRVGVAVIGLEVPHAHIHLVPINGVHDLDFSKPKHAFTEEEFRATAQKISEAL